MSLGPSWAHCGLETQLPNYKWKCSPKGLEGTRCCGAVGGDVDLGLTKKGRFLLLFGLQTGKGWDNP